MGAGGIAFRSAAAKPWPIEHVVIIIKENRSFDHLFGSFPGVNGAVDVGISNGREIPLTPAVNVMPIDLPHHWNDGQKDINGGKMDGFARNNPLVTRYAYSQFRPEQMPNYWYWAREYSLSDHFFASHAGPSFPNHLYLIAAQAGGALDTPVGAQAPPGRAKTWGCDSLPTQYIVVVDHEGEQVRVPTCFDFQTEGDLLTEAGIDWAYYAASETQNGYIWNSYAAIRHIRETDEWTKHIRPVDDVVFDIAEDRLPAVTWITPQFPYSEHPIKRTNFCHGENWTTRVVNEIMRSPMWRNTAIFITWDDWGGFYDHVPPPGLDQFGLGIRVPLLTISPYAKEGHVDHELGEFSSILRFVEDHHGLSQLTHRDAGADNLSYNFDFDQPPRPPDPLPLRRNCYTTP
jgi:phospholipase C